MTTLWWIIVWVAALAIVFGWLHHMNGERARAKHWKRTGHFKRRAF